MIKKELYPKTKRLGIKGRVFVTEKVDGSNLCLFKTNGTLEIAQRNNIYTIYEIDSIKDIMYKGLYGWLKEHGMDLQDQLNENSVICGEWVGMGKLPYNFKHRFLMFAKANITEDVTLKNINYTHDFFIYPFKNKTIPDYIGIVPVVYDGVDTSFLYKERLDDLYADYAHEEQRPIEGFVVNFENTISKYVRMKSGKLEEHYANGEGGKDND